MNKYKIKKEVKKLYLTYKKMLMKAVSCRYIDKV